MSSRNHTRQNAYQLGQWTLFPAKLQICGPTGTTNLPAKAFDVINQLIANPGETVSREQFIETIWRGQKDVGDKALNQAIWQLRRAFAETGDDTEVISTVARIGYVLLQNVTMSSQQIVNSRAGYNQPWWLLLALILIPVATVWALKPQTAAIQPPSPRPDILTHYKGAEETPTFTADGRYMAFQWDKGSGLPGIYAVDLLQTDSEPQKVSAEDEFAASPSYSADGKQLAYAVIEGQNCRIKIHDLPSNSGQLIDRCYSESIVNTLSWSKVSNQLAYAYRNVHGGISIRGYQPQTGEYSQLSAEQNDVEDYPLSWANQHDTLAFASQKSGLGNIYLRYRDDQIRALLKEPQPIYSLAWSPDDRFLYFSTVWQSEMAIMQVSIKDGSVTPLSYNSMPGRIAVRPGQQPQLVYPRYTSMEQLFRLTPGNVPEVLPFSYGRELYPLYAASQRKLVFFSNKGGSFQLWAAAPDSEIATRIADIQGSAYVHAISNSGDAFLLPVKQDGDSHYSLYLGNFEDTKLQKLSQINYAAKNFSWGKRDQSLLYSSDVNGHWQIWRHYLDSGIREQLTLTGGVFAVDGDSDQLFYVKPDGGIWRLTADQQHELLVEQLSSLDWGNWLLRDDGILYIQRTPEADLVKLRDWQGQHSILASLPARTIKSGRSITQLPDGSLVLSMYQSKEADIVGVDIMP